VSAEHLYSAANPDDLLTVPEGAARISADTLTVFWQGAAKVANSIKADALEEVAAELRRRPALRGVPATVDARGLEARAKALRLGARVSDQ
jgi:hypothetical protein